MKYRRAILDDVEGYVPGEQTRDPEVIKLNTNENPYPSSPRVVEALQQEAARGASRYPDPLSVELRSACARRYGFEGPEWVIAGNGMDELLSLTLRTFADPGDTILAPNPTYVIYETLTRLHGAEYLPIDLDSDFQLPESFFAQKGRICFLARPGAPSGVCVSIEAVERLCREFDGLVFIDEAYVDFASESCVDFPRRFDNVIVGRTFSKSFSLAGLRVGIAMASPEIISEFLKTKDSYNLNALSQAGALAALADYAHMEANASKIISTRSRLHEGLTGLGFNVPPSESNFVWAQWEGTPTARELVQGLRERQILVRYFDVPELETGLRITVGTDAEIDSLLSALGELL